MQIKNNHDRNTKIRILIMLLTFLFSTNVKIEIIRPTLSLQISVESISNKPVQKIIKWFEN